MANGILKQAINNIVDALGNLVGWQSGQGQDFGAVLVLGQQHVAVSAPADTNENTLYSLTIPGGMMGPNDTLRISYLGTCTNSANTKNLRVRFGGTAFQSSSVTTVAGVSIITSIKNRNSVAAQAAAASAAGDCSGSVGLLTATVNTANAQTLTITGTKASAGETLTLESVLVELIRGA